MSEAILLTGATGFLGSHLLARLVGEGRKVVVLKRSTSNTRRIAPLLDKISFFDLDTVSLEAVFRHQKFSAVIHCATRYGRNNVDPSELIAANLVLPLTLLQLADRYGCPVFLNSDTILDTRVNYYSLSKGQFVEWLEKFSDRLSCANIALEHFYGPGDDPSKFVSSFVSQLLARPESIDLSPGRQKREFIFIDDVIEAYLLILEAAQKNRTGYLRFDVGTGVKTEIRDIVQRIKTLTGNTATQLRFGALPYRPNEVMDSNVDCGRMFGLGWRPQVDLEEGLRRTVEFEKRARGYSA